MKYVILILTLGLVGCGRAPGTYEGFEMYVEGFLVEARARGAHVSMYGVDIKLVDEMDPSLAPGTIGACDFNSGRITLLKSSWNKYPEIREEIVFHELGHCALLKGHSDCPNLMCPSVPDSSDYLANRSHYLDVLFSTD